VYKVKVKDIKRKIRQSEIDLLDEKGENQG